MRTHQEQIQAEPHRPVTLPDRDVSTLIGMLAILEGEVLAVLEGDLVSDEASHLVDRLRIRLIRDGLLPADADEQALARALGDMNHRLRVARGEYDGIP